MSRKSAVVTALLAFAVGCAVFGMAAALAGAVGAGTLVVVLGCFCVCVAIYVEVYSRRG